ncbi:MAG: hypothetical protein HY900_10325 [Deltaproteobacteria bacterium]|nr:hypothetical protein [Deltaproteobacteria bacterium]
MKHMLVRNKVKNYDTWRRIVDSQKPLHQDAGLRLLHLWRTSGNRNEVYLLFEMWDEEKAKAFVISPENPRIGREAGVIDGEVRYLEELEGY